MILDRNHIKKNGYVYGIISASSDEHALIIFIVERYSVFPAQVIETIGMKNLLRCYEYYLDFHYNNILYPQKK
jgi:hypothetical protein